jgi:hypothetical protein
MPRPDRSSALDHIVVIMFENRSFDNLLGRLYEPGEVASFEGVAGLDLSNPVPDWAAGADPGTAPRLVPYGTAVTMNTPSPDPGEEYPHVNTQLFGLIDPPSNRGMVFQHIVAPYNAPPSPDQRPTMDGFVTAYNTLFMVTFDEHGGTYDHVPPPAVLPPDPTAPAGQMGFRFDRSGVRVPAIAVSAWIPEQTVINDQYRHTSVIRTLRERWQLGAPLTARDAAALDLAPVLSLDIPRDPDDWPDVTPRPVQAFSPARVRLEARLKGLCQAACFPVLALAKDMGLPAPDIDQDEAIGRADAIALIDEVFGHMFPGLHAS